jgi:TPR repeat protein
MSYEYGSAVVDFLEGNFSEAAKMFLEGAREGDILASFNYAYCLWRGIGVKKNVREAKSFFAFARDMKGGESCYNLAMIYMQGDEVPRDYNKAFDYMKASAERGCVEAQLYLGMAYTAGCIFEPDVVGIKMIPTHTPEYAMDMPLLEGPVPEFDEADEDRRYQAVKQDQHLAFQWFQISSRHDPTNVEELVAKGKYLYAKCYVDGLGVEFDKGKANRLMLLAGKSGSPEAIRYLAENGILELTPEVQRFLQNGE